MREMGSFKPGECVGGAGAHWGGMTRRFLPWDFETRSRTIERYGAEHDPRGLHEPGLGHHLRRAGAVLRPVRASVRHRRQGGQSERRDPARRQSVRRSALARVSRIRPTPRRTPGTLFAKAARVARLQAVSDAHGDHDAAVHEPVQAHAGPMRTRRLSARSHGCANGAKATPLTTVLPALLKHENFELRPLANVIKVNLDSDRKARGRRHLHRCAAGASSSSPPIS